MRTIRPAIRQAVAPAVHGATAGGGGEPVLSPIQALVAKYPGASLYATNAAGFAGLSQDTQGAAPVTAFGQSVGRLDPVHGTGPAFIQPDVASRMVVEDYYSAGLVTDLLADGINDGMYTEAAVDLSGTNAITIGMVAQYVDGALGILLEHSVQSGTNAGTFRLVEPSGASNGTILFVNAGTTASSVSSVEPSTNPNVTRLIGNIGAPLTSLSVGGVQKGSSTNSLGTGNYSSQVMYLGRRANGSMPFSGQIFRFGWFPVQLAGDELATFDAWLNDAFGAP